MTTFPARNTSGHRNLGHVFSNTRGQTNSPSDVKSEGVFHRRTGNTPPRLVTPGPLEMLRATGCRPSQGACDPRPWDWRAQEGRCAHGRGARPHVPTCPLGSRSPGLCAGSRALPAAPPGRVPVLWAAGPAPRGEPSGRAPGRAPAGPRHVGHGTHTRRSPHHSVSQLGLLFRIVARVTWHDRLGRGR